MDYTHLYIVLLFCVSFVLLHQVFHLYSNRNSIEVVTLTDDTFDDYLANTPSHKWFVKIYAPWCGHCKHLAPTWEKLEKEIGDTVYIGEIDGTTESGLAERFHIEGFPTLLLFFNGSYVEYDGKRDLQELKEFALERYVNYEATPIPRMPMSFSIMSEKLGLQLSGFLFSYPLITCLLILFVGIIIGLLLVTIYFEVFAPTPLSDMDETPEIDKEKDE